MEYKEKKHIRTMDGLRGEHLVAEILSWLPVKALLRFKSVCKSWYALIKSPHFISMHHKHYCTNNNNNCILAQYHESYSERDLYELHLDGNHRILSIKKHLKFGGLRHDYSIICGPCHGKYLLLHKGARTSYDEYYNLSLWNPSMDPSMDQLKALPQNQMINCKTNMTYRKDEIVFSFGEHPMTKDCQVIVIAVKAVLSKTNYQHPSSILIYSLSTDSWRYWGDLEKYYHLKNNTNVFVHGCSYWLGSYKWPQSHWVSWDVMVCFDMVADEFREIRLPEYYERPTCETDPDCHTSTSLGIYHGSIAFFTLNEECFNIWVQNGMGSWTKNFTITLTLPFEDYRYERVVGHWKDKVVFDYGTLVLFDPGTQEIRQHLKFDHLCWCDRVFEYMESLLPISESGSRDTATCGI